MRAWLSYRPVSNVRHFVSAFTRGHVSMDGGGSDTISSFRPSSRYKPRYIDVCFVQAEFKPLAKKAQQIGINLADPIFRGRYHGSQRHPDDLEGVVQRAREVGCSKLIVTGSSLKSSRDALQLAGQFREFAPDMHTEDQDFTLTPEAGVVFTTAGIHPCSSSVFSKGHQTSYEEDASDGEHTPACESDAPHAPETGEIDHARTELILRDLRTLIDETPSLCPAAPAAVVAFGEFGLDYDRLHYCPQAVQRHSFAAQLKLAGSLQPQLPLFLHSRAAHADFVGLLKVQFGTHLERLERAGVVHSFTGTMDEMRELAHLGLYIGVNGCSFKTEENCAVVGQIPLDRIMLETDGPWCEVRPSHAGWQYLITPKETPAGDAVGQASSSGLGAHEGQEKGKKGKKNQQKEPDVPQRFKVVKKEKWEEGAMVKGRNEPCTIERVATIVARIKGITVEEVCENAWANTTKIFGI